MKYVVLFEAPDESNFINTYETRSAAFENAAAFVNDYTSSDKREARVFDPNGQYVAIFSRNHDEVVWS